MPRAGVVPHAVVREAARLDLGAIALREPGSKAEIEQRNELLERLVDRLGHRESARRLERDEPVQRDPDQPNGMDHVITVEAVPGQCCEGDAHHRLPCGLRVLVLRELSRALSGRVHARMLLCELPVCRRERLQRVEA
jgi:hypothetical protein